MPAGCAIDSANSSNRLLPSAWVTIVPSALTSPLTGSECGPDKVINPKLVEGGTQIKLAARGRAPDHGIQQ